MDINLATQVLLREQILKNIDLDTIESLITDRVQLMKALGGTLEQVLVSNNLYLNAHNQREMVALIADELTGFGPLRELMEDDAVSDILVNGPECIFIEKEGLLQQTARRFLNNAQLTDIAKRLVHRAGRRIDEGQPMVDARLSDGSRINVVINPVSLDGTALSIRKFSKNKKSLEDLLHLGAMDAAMANFLIIAARCRVNIIISGGTGSGKTTLLNALSQYIDDAERVLTLEDAAELCLHKSHVVRMETRMAGVENTGRITMRSLVINALRMRPDRLIIGECRGEEAFEMLQAMNTGHDGSMSTLHANNPRDVISRLESMVMMCGMNMPGEAIRRNISSAIDLIVQVSRMNDGSRRITNIAEIMGIEGDRVLLQDIFSFHPDRQRDEQGRIVGEFRNHGLLMRSSIREHASLFNLDEELQQLFMAVSA